VCGVPAPKLKFVTRLRRNGRAESDGADEFGRHAASVLAFRVFASEGTEMTQDTPTRYLIAGAGGSHGATGNYTARQKGAQQ